MKKNKSKGLAIKHIIFGLFATLLIVSIIYGDDLLTKQAIGSVYNISELGDNYYDIQIGDEVNYEINGYSDWQVIGKDEYNGTIDVVSKTNTENIMLEYNQTKEYYENKLQETANKYTDNSYAVAARTVSQEDLEMFSYTEDFITSSIVDNNTIKTSNNEWEINPNHKLYVIPYIKYGSYSGSFSEGEIINYSKNGIDRWVVFSTGSSYDYPNRYYYAYMIPETPIELVIDSVDDDANTKINEIINSFSSGTSEYGNLLGRYGTSHITNYLSNFLNQQTDKIVFISQCNYNKNNNKIESSCGRLTSYVDGQLKETPNSAIYTDTSVPDTIGYRPVVSLKVKKEVENQDKKEISNKLQVGDYVKYEAKGYNNWKVLSIDEALGTVNIISGGIVKNISLTGKEDWDNYEDIIQKEVDEYKVGDNVIRATTVTSNDLTALKEIDKGALSRYWILSKESYLDYSPTMFGGRADIIDYKIDTIYLYKYDNYEMKISSIIIYTGVNGEGLTYERYLNYVRDYTYSAGIRPVITLKLDNVEKLPDEEAEKIEEQTEKQEKVLIREQESKNKDYKGPIKVNDTTSSTGITKSDKECNDVGNKESRTIEKIVYKEKPLYKYGFIIFLITSIVELGIIIFMSNKIKK